MSGKSTQKKNTTKENKGKKRLFWRNNYFRYIFQKEQVLDWLVILLAVVLGCLFVTRTYPYPYTIEDSFGYIWAAFHNSFVYLRPFGYSFFLRLIHAFSDSIYSVIVSNALIYILSLGLLTLAVKKYWPPRKKGWFYALEAVVAFSPAAIFMLNSIMADALNCSLVFVIIAMLIVIIQEESWLAIVVYAAALFASLHTRYSSVFFPIAIIPILALKGKAVKRVVSIALTIAAVLVFRVQTINNMETFYSLRQYSTGFDGWQLANNAIHLIPAIRNDEKVKMPEDKEVKELHRFVMIYNHAHRTIQAKTNNGKAATAGFIWLNDSPLKQYFFRQIKDQKSARNIMWIIYGSGIYKDYGIWLILHYPWRFIRYYLIPNAKEAFYTTNLECICGSNIVPAGKKEIVEWFDFPTDKTMEKTGDLYGTVFRPLLKWIELLTWLIFIASLVILLMTKKKGDAMPRESVISLWALFLFGLIYYGTVTFASPIALRYWMPMHAVKLMFAWIAISDSPHIRASRAQS